MTKQLLLISILFASFSSFAREPVELKMVSLTEFMQDGVAAPTELPIPVPKDYEPASIPDAPVGYSYWMRAKDVQKANRTGDLPSKNGYMYGKISLDVGYDKDSDIFVGAEDPQSISQAKSAFATFAIERCRFENYPVLLLTAEAPGSKNLLYAVYVASGIDTNTVFLGIRPPNNSRAIGDQIFSALKDSLSACSTVSAAPGASDSGRSPARKAQ